MPPTPRLRLVSVLRALGAEAAAAAVVDGGSADVERGRLLGALLGKPNDAEDGGELGAMEFVWCARGGILGGAERAEIVGKTHEKWIDGRPFSMTRIVYARPLCLSVFFQRLSCRHKEQRSRDAKRSLQQNSRLPEEK